MKKRRRVFEYLPGFIGLALHLYEAYQLLLKLDEKGQRKFRVVGVCGYLCQKLGSYERGFAAYMSLVKVGLVQSLGRVSGKGNLCEFMVYRKPVKLLRVDYREHKKSSKRKTSGHHAVATKKHVSGIGAYKPIRRATPAKKSRNVAFEPPRKLLIALLKHAGLDTKVLPKRTLVDFIFD